MTVINSTTDANELMLTVVAEFEAEPERVWDVWADPRKLERWWGPPTYPATFARHEFHVGGQCRYFMTGPTGDQPHGWWRIDALDEPRRIEFVNGLAGDDGEPVAGRRADGRSRDLRADRVRHAYDGDHEVPRHRADGEDARHGHA